MRNGSPHYWLMHTAMMAAFAAFAYFRNPEYLQLGIFGRIVRGMPDPLAVSDVEVKRVI